MAFFYKNRGGLRSGRGAHRRTLSQLLANLLYNPAKFSTLRARVSYFISKDTFLISDSHFGHQAVLLKEPIRSKSALLHGFRDFDEFSVAMWNRALSPKDRIWHLGDLYFGSGYKLLKKLNGTKLLIVGNNDIGKYEYVRGLKQWSVCDKLHLQIPESRLIKDYLKQKFGKQALKNIYLNAVVCDVEGERIMFSHFPVFNRKPRDRFANARDILDTAFRLAQCSLNIHGHLHSRESGNDFCVNVSCEKLGFIPRTLGEVLRSHRKKRSFDD